MLGTARVYASLGWWVAIGYVDERMAEHVAISGLLDELHPIVGHAGRQIRRALGPFIFGSRAGVQVTLAGSVVGRGSNSGDVAFVVAVTRFQRRPPVTAPVALVHRKRHHAADVVTHLAGMEWPPVILRATRPFRYVPAEIGANRHMNLELMRMNEATLRAVIRA